ncbi:MAG: glycosyltransferase family 9 protein [Methylibium sp.]|uniref:glycosyltransferase family 9 protein n=1 Tax=Methylibium sp. TaxID=2067992 RepID=UPI00183210C9|nr:glycosyltransferase family 9 protein [Methylibium sp.]MBA3596573.1 glycosyltransferase family 9 protein [Methylibium sp.]
MQRILVIRLSALGDVVMASGLIPALRALWPQAHIAWLVEPAAAPLLSHNPRLDEVIVWPRGEWQRLWRERRFIELWRHFSALRATLRERRFDLVLDAQGLLKSGLWSWLSGAPRRLSLIGRESSHRLATERVVPPAQVGMRLIGAEYRHLAKHLGAPAEAFRLDLAVGDEARRKVRDKLAGAELRAAAREHSALAALRAASSEPGPAASPAAASPARYVVLCPFTTRPQKHWFEDRWQALAQRFLESGLRPVLLGGPSDREAAERIAAGVPGLVNLAGVLPLDESVAAIGDAAVLIGVDTGLTHMAVALGVPSVALFGSTRPYLDTGSARSVVLYEHLPCAPCRRHPTCGGRFDCMRAFEAERVFDDALRVLAGTVSIRLTPL